VDVHMREEAMGFRQRRWVSGVLGVLVGLSIVAIGSRVLGQGAEPVLTIPAPSHDMGTVWEGETMSHAFEVKNEGTAELKILEVKPG
jgi:hypothetical protein